MEKITAITTKKTAAKNLTIAIASGGTSVPIDKVRVITNHSRGTTGALLAESAISRGHQVEFVAAKHSVKPFVRNLVLDPQKNLAEELKRLEAEVLKLQALKEKLTVNEVENFTEYHSAARLLAARTDLDVAIFSVAASDYAPQESSFGKISSASENLDLKLQKLPKVISDVRSINPKLFTVGFKLELGISLQDLIKKAYKSLFDNKLDLVVANLCSDKFNSAEMQTFIITPEKGVIKVARENLSDVLLDLIESRFSRNYFKTKLTKLRTLSLPADIEANFIELTHNLASLAVFPRYLEGQGGEFGFVAQRTNQGTLISARGSSKRFANNREIALVTELDEEKREIAVSSLGKKAALNANLAHRIFQLREDVNLILHSHISLPSSLKTFGHSAPGTIEDWSNIESAVLSGARIIEQADHGVFILAKDYAEVLEQLRASNIYAKHGQDYDLAYSHFCGRSKLIDIFEAEVAKDALVVDLAAGTGAVSLELFNRGYKKINLVEASASMLDQAREKLLGKIPSQNLTCGSLQDWTTDSGKFDAAILRQAINYIPVEDLLVVFKNIHASLNTGGKIFLNTFDPNLLVTGIKEREKNLVGDFEVAILEGNLKYAGQILHGQRAEIFDNKNCTQKVIYDFNSFYPHQAKFLEDKLHEAGFKSVQVITEAHSIYLIAEK